MADKLMDDSQWAQAIIFANQLPQNILVLMPLARERQLLLDHSHALHQLIERTHDAHQLRHSPHVCSCELCCLYQQRIRKLCETAP